MKAITLRGLDDTTGERLKKAAMQEGKSSNQFILDTLKEKLGMKKQRKHTVVHHDMDELFGLWSERDFREVQGKIDSGRKIDQELWR
jgi:hypothetical protein